MEINDKTAPVTGQQDRNTISLDLMGRMKLHGMAEAFRESLAGTTPQSMTADTFLSMLLAREWDHRAQAAIVRLTKNADTRPISNRLTMPQTGALSAIRWNASPPLTLYIRGRTSSLPALQVRGKAIWHVPLATRHAKGDSALSMPMHPNCLAH